MGTMYFHSRTEAGQRLATELTMYAQEDCVVIALSKGGVRVGEPIALQLACELTMLLSETILLPGERQPVGTVGQSGDFSYSTMLSAGEIEEYYSEFHGYIEDQKREKFNHLNRLFGRGGSLDAKRLKGHVVIAVADGLKTGLSLDVLTSFLKPVRIKRLILATPIASVQAVDRMHIIADELHCLGVTENYISTSHYYEVDDAPSYEDAIAIIQRLAVVHEQI